MTLCFRCLVNHEGWQQKDLRFCHVRWSWLAHTRMKHLPNCVLEVRSPDSMCPKLDKWQSWSFPGSVGNVRLSCGLTQATKSPLLVHRGREQSPCGDGEWLLGLNLRMCSVDSEESFGHCLFVSVELWGHNLSCEATIISCSIVRYEFELGMVKMGFPLA